MSKYVVAIYNAYDNEITQHVEEADTEFDALVSAVDWEAEDLGNISTLDELLNALYNQECVISIIEIN